METGTGTVIHVFEKAGLGKAPFRFVGMHKEVYCACPGAPVQPGSSCDYCGQGIMFVCTIQSADGRRFKVGCDCVHKTGDAGLRKVVDAAKAKVDREARHARDAARIEEALALLPTVEAKLAAQPHPRGFAGLTKLDWAHWMLKNAGTTGKLQVAKAITVAAKEG